MDIYFNFKIYKNLSLNIKKIIQTFLNIKKILHLNLNLNFSSIKLQKILL